MTDENRKKTKVLHEMLKADFINQNKTIMKMFMLSLKKKKSDDILLIV